MSTVKLACDARSTLGEALLWHPESGTILWLDLPERRLLRLPVDAGASKAPGAADTLDLETGEQLACLARHPGGLLLVTASGARLLKDDRLAPAPLSLPAIDPTRHCFNDGEVDRHGHLWLGSSHLEETEAEGRLWRIAPDGTAVEIDRGFIVSNGPAFSPDGRVAYFADTFARRILAYDLDDSGSPTGRRVFHEGGPGYPDGLCVTTEGHVLSCRWDGATILVLDPDGREGGRIDVPARNVTSCAFGGTAVDRLFITTARIETDPADPRANGALFVSDDAGHGLIEPVLGAASGA